MLRDPKRIRVQGAADRAQKSFSLQALPANWKLPSHQSLPYELVQYLIAASMYISNYYSEGAYRPICVVLAEL